MPIKFFANSSNFSENKIDPCLFVQKPYLRTKDFESYFEDFDFKSQ